MADEKNRNLLGSPFGSAHGPLTPPSALELRMQASVIENVSPGSVAQSGRPLPPDFIDQLVTRMTRPLPGIADSDAPSEPGQR